MNDDERVAAVQNDDDITVTELDSVLNDLLEACKTTNTKKVVDILNKFGTTFEEVAASGCSAIVAVVKNDGSKVELGRLGACAAVVKVLKSFGMTVQKVAK